MLNPRDICHHGNGIPSRSSPTMDRNLPVQNVYISQIQGIHPRNIESLIPAIKWPSGEGGTHRRRNHHEGRGKQTRHQSSTTTEMPKLEDASWLGTKYC